MKYLYRILVILKVKFDKNDNKYNTNDNSVTNKISETDITNYTTELIDIYKEYGTFIYGIAETKALKIGEKIYNQGGLDAINVIYEKIYNSLGSIQGRNLKKLWLDSLQEESLY